MHTLWIIAALAALCAAIGAEAQQPEKAALKHEFARVNGLKLHYVTAGSGKTILFLHGFPEFWYEWRRQLPAFAEKGYQAVAFDMRGYNLSEKPTKVEDYAISQLVEDVKGMLETVSRGKKAILVAHDWGGAVAWAFAAAHPEMLEKLVIINAPHPAVFTRELADNPRQQQASGYMTLFRSPQAEMFLSANHYAALSAGVLDTWLPPTKITDEERNAYLEAWAQPGALTGGLNYYRAARIGPPAPGKKSEPSGFETLQKDIVSVPTLVIWGEKDTALLTGNLAGLEKYVPHLTIQRIPDGSHWVIHEQPERITTLIADFLKEEPISDKK